MTAGEFARSDSVVIRIDELGTQLGRELVGFAAGDWSGVIEVSIVKGEQALDLDDKPTRVIVGMRRAGGFDRKEPGR